MTYDARITCIFNQVKQSSMQDQNKIIANLNYVGVLKGVLVDYFGLCLVLFKCSWIPPNLCGNARTICQDEHGFWQVNFRCRLPPTMEPYVFPIIVSHVLTSTSEVPLENHTYKTQNIKWSINVIMVLVDWVGRFIKGFTRSNICGDTKGVVDNGNYVVVKP